MKIKKILALLLSLIMILSLPMGSLDVKAASEFIISGTNGQVEAGNQVSIDLILENNPGFCALNLYYTYNMEYFTLETVENRVSSFTMTHMKTSVWDAANNYTEDGTLATLTFSVAEDTPAGEYQVDIMFLSAANDSFEAVEVQTKEATIVVIPQGSVKAEAVNILDGDSGKGYVGHTWWLDAELQPENCVPESIAWTSSDESVVNIWYTKPDGGASFTFVSEGTATVTATTKSGLADQIQLEAFEVPEITVGTEMDCNYTDEWKTGMYFKFVPKQSGSYRFSFDNESYGVDMDLYESGALIAESYGNSLTYDFVAGNTYEFNVMSSMKNVTYHMSLTEVVGISNLEIVSYPVIMDYWKGADNYWNYWGLKLKATYPDGEVAYWTYGDGNLGEYSVDFETYYNETTKEYSDIEISCGNQSVSFSFNIIENPVDSIQILSGEIPELIEHVDGYWEWNNEFVYKVDKYIEDMLFQINYKDGTSKTGVISQYLDDSYLYNISYEMSSYGIWTLESDNYITVSYAGKSLVIPVTVIENPVECIELVTPPSREYVWGDITYGWLSKDGIYGLYPDDLKGLSFVVYFKDGTQKKYSDEDIDETDCIAGHSLSFDYVSTESLETTGTYPVICTYMNHEMEYNIKVIETNVSAIEVIQDPVLTTFDSRYEVDFTGMKIKITYNDATSETVEITRNNATYTFDTYVYCAVLTGNNTINIYFEEDGSYGIHYLGITGNYNGINKYIGKAIATLDIPNLSFAGDNITLSVTYEDQSKENIILDFFEFYGDTYSDGTSWFEGYANTGKGFLYIWTEPTENKDEYWVYVLDEEFYIDLSSQEAREEVIITTDSRMEDGTGTSLDVKGAGTYYAGDSVTITAEERIGYKFLGWYELSEDGNNYIGDAISAEFSCTFVVEENMNFVAIYKQVDYAMLKVNGAGFTVNGGVNQLIYNYAQEFNVGTEIKLIATGENFAYWMNDSNKIVSTEKEYVFTLLQATTVTVVYKNATAKETAFVEFVSDYDQVLQAQNYSVSSNILLPNGPTKSGYVFQRWNMTISEIKEAIRNGETYIRVKPVYEKLVEYFDVTVIYDGNTETPQIYQDVTGYEFLELTSKAIEGRKFAYWSDAIADGNVLGTSEVYRLYVNKDVTVYAIYVDAEEDVKFSPTITMTNAYTSVDNTGTKKVHFEATREITDGYILQEHGALYGTNTSFSGAEAENIMVIGSSDVKKSIGTTTGNVGVYVLSVNVGTKVDTVVYARGYMILQNETTGETITVYSQIVSGSYNELSGTNL